MFKNLNFPKLVSTAVLTVLIVGPYPSQAGDDGYYSKIAAVCASSTGMLVGKYLEKRFEEASWRVVARSTKVSMGVISFAVTGALLVEQLNAAELPPQISEDYFLGEDKYSAHLVGLFQGISKMDSEDLVRLYNEAMTSITPERPRLGPDEYVLVGYINAILEERGLDRSREKDALAIQFNLNETNGHNDELRRQVEQISGSSETCAQGETCPCPRVGP